MGDVHRRETMIPPTGPFRYLGKENTLYVLAAMQCNAMQGTATATVLE